MARRLAITARQVTALCKGAARAGYFPIVQIGDVSVRFLPENAELNGIETKTDLDRELDEWESANSDIPRIPIWGKKAALHRSDKEHRYTAETDEQRAIRHAKVLAQWELDLHRSDLERHEQSVMDQLASRPDEPQHISTIAMAGPVTVDRLVLRGFVEVVKSAQGKVDTLTLTSEGRRALAERERRRARGWFRL